MSDGTDWYSDDAATFGDRLAAAREAAGMSPAELAKRLGVKTAVLVDWENDLKEPRANRLSMLSGLLGISLSWLLTGKGEGPDAPLDEDASSTVDALSILTEMRALRAQIASNADTLAHLEKRMRKILETS